MIISAIVAMNSRGVIGLDNKIPWHLPADLKFFKYTTSNHHILMGRKCFESIGKALPNRTNIIVTKNLNYVVTDCIIVHSIEEGIRFALQNKENELFIIGGGEIYLQSLPYVNKLYVTMVETNIEGDTFFPDIDWNKWFLVSKENFLKDNKNSYNYSFNTYTLIT